MRDLDWKGYDVLVVDDEPDNLDAFRFAFRKAFRLHFAGGGEEALAMIDEVEPAVIVADQRMPGMSGIELLAEVKGRFPDTYAVLLTAYADLGVLIDAVNTGAVDRYVPKPWDSKELTAILRQGIRNHATLAENKKLRDQLAQYAGYLERQQRDPMDFGAIVGGGAATERVLEQIAEVAETRTPVVIEGERGLEHDVVARALHTASDRERQPFVSVTCAAFDADGLERELFGWSRGAFEGALQDRAGRVELADGGTLYLHQPTGLARTLQARLHTLLKEGTAERVGETRARALDVRVIVSAAPSLNDALGESPLEDLQRRLRVFPIALSPLRERRDDVPALAKHFLDRYARRNARAATAIRGDALDQLIAYDWPGNVAELENMIERAAILARADEIQPSHLSFRDAAPASVEAKTAAASSGLSLSGKLDAIERRELIAALEAHGGNKAEVARALGIHRTTLYYRLKKLRIDA